MYRFLLRAAVASAIAAPSFAAGAQCGGADNVLDYLKSHYGEDRAFSGVIAGDHPFTVTVNQTTGTWTILLPGEPGQLCASIAGDHWHAEAAKPDVQPNALPTPALLDHDVIRISEGLRD